MLHACWQVPGFAVTTWQQAASPDEPSQDSLLVLPRGEGLRVCVIDGAWGGPDAPERLGMEAGQYASVMTHAAMSGPGTLTACAQHANVLCHDPTLRRKRDNPQAALAACDLRISGRTEMLRGGDCQIWGRRGDGRWIELLGGDMLNPAARGRWEHFRATTPDFWGQQDQADQQLLGRPDAWAFPHVGRFASVQVTAGKADGLTELVLASDGIELTEGSFEDLPRTVTDRAGALQRYGQRKDLTVLHVRRTGA